MPDFSELFIKSKGQPILYKEQVLVLADKFPVSNGDLLVISIERTNSDCPQGVAIDITGSCEVNGKLWQKGKGVNMLFWEDATLVDPKHIEIKVFTKKDFVWVQNIWETTNSLGKKSAEYSRYGAAMIVEEIENGRRYRCNDWHPDENFDDIVFTVQKVNL
jgi:hypothetical protein